MTRLEYELSDLKQRALDMGTMAESMVDAAARAIAGPDMHAVGDVLGLEPKLDDLQLAIDRETIRLITVYSPAARDLRFLMMLVRITSDIERTGDQAVDICEYLRLLPAPAPAAEPLSDLTRMSELSLRMFRDALNAFRHEDAGGAAASLQLDSEVDALEARIVRGALRPAASESEIARRSAGMLVARALERVADHAKNICEEVFYVVEGEDIRQAT